MDGWTTLRVQPWSSPPLLLPSTNPLFHTPPPPYYPNRQEEKETVGGCGRRTFVWEQPVSTPSYLVALAVGDLEARDISPR